MQAAIKNVGLPYPRRRLVVNLAPATVRKEGPTYDLPIAVGVLIYSGLLPPEAVKDALVVGELSLDGTVRHARGVLPMAAVARQEGFKRIFVPLADAAEAALIPGLEVIAVESLAQLYAHLTGSCPICCRTRPSPSSDLEHRYGDRLQRNQRPGARQARLRSRGGRERTTC